MRLWRVCVCVLLSVAMAGVGCRRPPEREAARRFRVRVVVNEPLTPFVDGQVGEVVDRLQSEFGLDAAKVVVEAARDRRRVVRELGVDGVDLVVSLGEPLGRQVRAEAQAHPDTAFVSEVGPPREPNLAVLSFQLDGAAYLAGVAAALAGGSRGGVIINDGDLATGVVVASFRQGFLSQVGTWRVEVKSGPEGVRALAAAGVKMALYPGDRLDAGVVAAAETTGLKLIVIGGVGLERNPDVVLAAVQVDLCEAVVRITRDVLDGTFGGRDYLFDLGSGVVDLELSPRFSALAGRGAAARLDEARAAVNAGMVEVEGMGL